MPRSTLPFALFVVLSALSIPASANAAPASSPILSAAEHWLELADEGDFGRTWDEAGLLLQKSVDRDPWARQLDAVRESLGPVLERRLVAPDVSKAAHSADTAGEFVVLRYKTSFSGKSEALETLTLMKSPDGQWRVVGYRVE